MRRLNWLVPVVALAVLLPTRADAQRLEKPWLVQVSGAYVLTSGAYGALVKDGWSVAGTVGYGITPAFYLLGSFASTWHGGAEGAVVLPDYTNYSYFGMFAFNATAQVTNWDLLLLLGAGGMTLSPEGGESSTFFALNGGARAYYYFTPSVGLALDFTTA